MDDAQGGVDGGGARGGSAGSGEREEAFLAVAGEILDGYAAALGTLDDERVNASPVPGVVNSAFALVIHVDGMAKFWLGSFVAGEDIDRDRDSEFRATGTVAEARALLDALRPRLAEWVRIALAEGIRNRAARGTSVRDFANASPEWVLDHVLHEFAQHLGHLEVCRDVLGAR
ncbi:mycothiol transferase [Dietzia sp.]|uniref:mycothiol transferase n=1 Tax=Dietzia sp. TaxID=1871616 RepID=UPI002FD8D822